MEADCEADRDLEDEREGDCEAVTLRVGGPDLEAERDTLGETDAECVEDCDDVPVAVGDTV